MRVRLLLLLLAAASCSDPCDRLADRTCAREGDSSRACQEIRKQASRAGEDDQAWCRSALSILDQGIGAAPDAGSR
jgi:uncharacterized protein YceK